MLKNLYNGYAQGVVLSSASVALALNSCSGLALVGATLGVFSIILENIPESETRTDPNSPIVVKHSSISEIKFS